MKTMQKKSSLNSKTNKLLNEEFKTEKCTAKYETNLNQRRILINKDGKEIAIPVNIPELKVEINADLVKLTVEPAVYLAATNHRKKFLRSIVKTLSKISKNAVKGLMEPYVAKMKIIGTGYKFESTPNELQITIGFSHKKIVPLPKGVTAKAANNKLELTGHDKQELFYFANMLFRIKGRIDVYKGTGIFFEGQEIKLKEIKKK